MRDRNARLYVTISLVSGFGGSTMLLVAPVWTLQLTGSSGLAAACGFFVYAPSLLGPTLGSLVDRLARQRVLVWTCLLMASLLLALLPVRSAGQIWLLYLVMLGLGFSYVLRHAAEAALLPASLPPDTLGQVNGLRMSAQEGMKLVAPLAGAGLFTWAGGSWVAVLVAAALVVTALLYSKVRVVRPPAAATVTSFREPVGYLLKHPMLRQVVFTGTVAAGMSGFATAAVYSVITTDLHRAPAFAGVLGAAQGAGSILGGVLVGRLLRTSASRADSRFPRGEPAIAAAGAGLFALGAALWSVPSTPLVVTGSVLAGVGLPWTVVAAVTAVQRQAPAAITGGVAATADMLIFAPIAVMIPAGAALAEFADHRLSLAIVVAAAGGAAAWPAITGARRRARPAKPHPGAVLPPPPR